MSKTIQLWITNNSGLEENAQPKKFTVAGKDAKSPFAQPNDRCCAKLDSVDSEERKWYVQVSKEFQVNAEICTHKNNKKKDVGKPLQKVTRKMADKNVGRMFTHQNPRHMILRPRRAVVANWFGGQKTLIYAETSSTIEDKNYFGSPTIIW